MHKSSISSVEIATGMFMLLFNSLFLPMFCYLPFILRYFMILCVFISCPSTFLSCALLPCPSIICSYPFIVPACHVQILTDRIFGMHDLGHHGGHNLYVWILGKKTNIHSYKSIFFRVHIPFMPFILLSVSCQFPFTSFHVPSISVNHIFVLRSPYLISLLSFCSFMSFWCSSGFPFRSSHFPSHFPSHVPSHFPFMSLSFYSLVTSVSFPFSFKSFHFSCMSCHFSKSYRISVHICFKLCSWSLVLFMIFLARLCIGVPIHYVIMCSSFKAV